MHINSCRMNCTLFGSFPPTLYDHYKKALKALLQNIENICRIHKKIVNQRRSFYTKTLFGTYFGLDLQVLNLLTFFILFLIRLTNGNCQIKTLKSSSGWHKGLTLSLSFFFFFFVICLFLCFDCFTTSVFSLSCLVFEL